MAGCAQVSFWPCTDALALRLWTLYSVQTDLLFYNGVTIDPARAYDKADAAAGCVPTPSAGLQVVPSRQFRRLGKAGGVKAGAKVGAAAFDEPAAALPISADDLLPRTDISAQITPTLLSNLNHSQVREHVCNHLQEST